MRLCVLGSGSKGNSIYVESSEARICIDAGLSLKDLRFRLAQRGLSLSDLQSVLLTHEHWDHIKGLSPLLNKTRIPLYANFETLRKIQGSSSYSIKEFETGRPFFIEDLLIEPFAISHDAADPVGFSIQNENEKVCIVTDLGRSTTLVREKLRGCSVLVIEANHDPEMLRDGPYPWELKQRVGGAQGHLSNRQMSVLLHEVSHSDLSCVMLAHLSEVNNHPEKARAEAEKALADCGLDGRVCVKLADQYKAGEIIEI